MLAISVSSFDIIIEGLPMFASGICDDPFICGSILSLSLLRMVE